MKNVVLFLSLFLAVSVNADPREFGIGTFGKGFAQIAEQAYPARAKVFVSLAAHGAEICSVPKSFESSRDPGVSCRLFALLVGYEWATSIPSSSVTALAADALDQLNHYRKFYHFTDARDLTLSAETDRLTLWVLKDAFEQLQPFVTEQSERSVILSSIGRIGRALAHAQSGRGRVDFAQLLSELGMESLVAQSRLNARLEGFSRVIFLVQSLYGLGRDGK